MLLLLSTLIIASSATISCLPNLGNPCGKCPVPTVRPKSSVVEKFQPVVVMERPETIVMEQSESIICHPEAKSTLGTNEGLVRLQISCKDVTLVDI